MLCFPIKSLDERKRDFILSIMNKPTRLLAWEILENEEVEKSNSELPPPIDMTPVEKRRVLLNVIVVKVVFLMVMRLDEEKVKSGGEEEKPVTSPTPPT
jgi:hypothetical protein